MIHYRPDQKNFHGENQVVVRAHYSEVLLEKAQRYTESTDEELQSNGNFFLPHWENV